jgi:UDP-3-O-[3-hydroxymyristoyl] glucosamine N-acyltransferase
MKRSLLSVAQSVQAQVIGDDAIEVSGIASISLATSADLVFVEDEKSLGSALESRAAAVIAGEFARGNTSSKPLLICRHPRLAFARAARMLYPMPTRTPGTHATAVIHASARLGRDVSIAERAVVGEKTEIKRGLVPAR